MINEYKIPEVADSESRHGLEHHASETAETDDGHFRPGYALLIPSGDEHHPRVELARIIHPRFGAAGAGQPAELVTYHHQGVDLRLALPANNRALEGSGITIEDQPDEVVAVIGLAVDLPVPRHRFPVDGAERCLACLEW